ncbi:MAG: elongation factor P [Lentisphaerae bacterium]|nr:elongation factor P [Lentisphaerota bacterium]
MYSASDLRKGLRIELEGVPYLITEFQFNKPGKGQALYVCRLKNLLTGGTHARTFRAVDKIGEPRLETKKLRYSYQDATGYVFLDANYEHATMSAEALGDQRFFLTEDAEVEVLYFNGEPIDITLPTFVEKTIVETEPGARGNTATNVLKPAKIEGGYEIQVPLFINTGDVAVIDTRTGAYVQRKT